MSNIVSRLEAALQLAGLPGPARENAKELLDSLSRPVIVAVLGASGAGKSALTNLLLKERLIPKTLRANLIEIVPGSEFIAEASYDDGRLEAHEEDELKDISGADRVHIASPNPILKDMVLIEASGAGSARSLALAIDDAAQRADIVLWCTHSFDENETELWERVDERLRDHAFLVLTKADKLARTRKLAEALGALGSVAEREFAGLMPIATLQALNALQADPFDEDLWAGSGADGLLGRINDHVHHGRQADIDQAELLLARYSSLADEGVTAANGQRTSQPRTATHRRRRSRMTREVVEARRNEAQEEAAATPEVDALAPRESEVVEDRVIKTALDLSAGTDSPAENGISTNRVTTRILEDDAVQLDSPVTKRPLESQTLADRLGAIRSNPSKPVAKAAVPVDPPKATDLAVKEIGKTAAALVRLDDDAERILNLCADTADSLEHLFESNPLPANLHVLRDEVLQTREHMTLLQLENTTGSAADAVSLLLQLKRDFQAQQAA